MNASTLAFARSVLARGRADELCPCSREVRGQSGDCGRCVDDRRSPAGLRSRRYRVRLAAA